MAKSLKQDYQLVARRLSLRGAWGSTQVDTRARSLMRSYTVTNAQVPCGGECPWSCRCSLERVSVTRGNFLRGKSLRLAMLRGPSPFSSLPHLHMTPRLVLFADQLPTSEVCDFCTNLFFPRFSKRVGISAGGFHIRDGRPSHSPRLGGARRGGCPGGGFRRGVRDEHAAGSRAADCDRD